MKTEKIKTLQHSSKFLNMGKQICPPSGKFRCKNGPSKLDLMHLDKSKLFHSQIMLR